MVQKAKTKTKTKTNRTVATDLDEQQIVRLYNQGIAAYHIARLLYCGTKKIVAILHKHGITIRKSYTPVVAYLPSSQEIERETEKIRKQWNDNERRSRMVNVPDSGVVIPHCKLFKEGNQLILENI